MGQAAVGEWFGFHEDTEGRFAHVDSVCQKIPAHGTLIKSHCDADLFLARYPVRPILWVVRDPRDTLVSWFHYLNNPAFYANNPQVERFQSSRFGRFLRRPLTDFLRHGYSLRGNFDNVAERWAAHTAGWSRSGLDLCVVRYESLLTDFEATLRRMADFLALELRPDPAPVALDERPSHLPRKGVIGDWKNEATPADLRWLDEVVCRRGVENFYHPAAGGMSTASGTSLPAKPAVPRRLLLLGPETEGELVSFEPVLRLLRRAWPETNMALFVPARLADLAPVLDSAGTARWLITPDNPSHKNPELARQAWEALRTEVLVFAPDCVAAARTVPTWLEGVVGACLPEVRQVRLGSVALDPQVQATVEALGRVDWKTVFPEKIPVDEQESPWERQLRLVGTLTGEEAPRWWPVAHVPADAETRAAQVLAEIGLAAGVFVACTAGNAGDAPEKSWPAAHYGETLAWLERERGLRTLLIGHASEREALEAVQAAARQAGANPALWLAPDGQASVTAGLLAAARFYFGHDTGALHLAAALEKPVVMVFGGGYLPKFHPVAQRSLTVAQSLPQPGIGRAGDWEAASPMGTISPATVRRALAQFLQDETPGQKVFRAERLAPGASALLDAGAVLVLAEHEDKADRLLFAREDSVYYGRQVQRLETLLKTSEADRDARGRQVEELLPLLKTSEADRDARQTQVQELTALLKTSEADRDARGRQVEELLPLLKTSEADRDARQTQVQELTALLKTSEADRDARYVQIQQLTAWVKEGNAERAALVQHVEHLTALLSSREAAHDQPEGSVSETATPESILPIGHGEPDGPELPKAKLTLSPASGTE